MARYTSTRTGRGVIRGLLLLAAVAVLPACHQGATLTAVLTSANQVDLTWTSAWVLDNRVDRSDDGGVMFTQLATLPGSARSYTDTSVAAGTTYTYRIITGRGTHSEVSNDVDVTTPWAATYGSPGDEDALAIAPAQNGGFFIGGDSNLLGSGSWDAWVLRCDPGGDISWQMTLGTGQDDWIDHVEPISDGGCVVVGTCDWADWSGKGWIARLAPDGSLAWERALSGADSDLLDVLEVSDGGFVAVGSYSLSPDLSDILLVKFSADGNLQWQRALETPDYEGASIYTLQIDRTASGGFVLCAAVESAIDGFWDVWVVMLSSSGSILGQRTFGGPDYEVPSMISQTSDGGYLVAAASSSFGPGDYDFWLLRLDSTGGIVWQRAYGGAGDDLGYWAEETRDGGIVVAGMTLSFGAGNEDFWVMRLQADGTVVWQKTYGGVESEWSYAMRIHETGDGGYRLCGTTYSAGEGGSDAWVLKLARDGTIPFSASSGVLTTDTSIVSSPTSAGFQDTSALLVTPSLVAGPCGTVEMQTFVVPRRQAP